MLEGKQLFFVNIAKQTVEEGSLDIVALSDNGSGFIGADKAGFPPVSRNRTAFKVALLHQLVDIYGDKVGFDSADFHDVSCGVHGGIIGKEHQDVKCGLRQADFLAKRAAAGGVCLEHFVWELDIHLHGSPPLLWVNRQRKTQKTSK